jgi:2,3-bisphosphoglycerate-dependent phosphoglycerate mutase
MKLYIMRHCERNLNNCSFESPLLDIGHINAKKLCIIMKNYNINTIYSSPFLRSIQTGYYYSKKNNIPINIDYSLCEFMDIKDKNLMYSINNYNIPNEWRQNYNINTEQMFKTNFNNNESITICINRVNEFLNYIENKYRNINKNILLITHMSIINIILHIKKNTSENFDIDKYYPMGLITNII